MKAQCYITSVLSIVLLHLTGKIISCKYFLSLFLLQTARSQNAQRVGFSELFAMVQSLNYSDSQANNDGNRGFYDLEEMLRKKVRF